jgi:hypothetical protein
MLISIIVAVLISLAYMAYTVFAAQPVDKDDEGF